MSAFAVGPHTLAEELALERERFAELEAKWNELYRTQWDAAQQLRKCGARIVVLERTQCPDPIPGYNPEGGAR